MPADRRAGGALGWAIVLLVFSGCGPFSERARRFEASLNQLHDAVSAERLFQDLERYVAFGHRYYGAAERERAVEMMVRDLEPHSDSVELQSFSAEESVSGTTYRLTNVIARRGMGASRRVLLGTHWDTRLWADAEADPELHGRPIPGANDGTSGVVVLIELLRVLAEVDALGELGVDVVLFDGEEFGREASPDAYSQGSRHFARELQRYYPERLPIAAIVIDMVGDRELSFRREAYSVSRAPGLSGLIWDLGRARFPEVFPELPRGPVFDDHVPLLEEGIPAVLLIDIDYEPWHTLSDTPERCSPESLALVTRHLAEVLLVLAHSPDLETTWEHSP